jgi:hypothetical protein
MLTLFTTARPFRGRTALIQRNALRSWTLLHRDVQIILFGDADGSQEVAWELGIHFEAHPQVTASGAVRMDYMFATAHRRARYRTLCYVPCDTLLLRDFCDALNRVEALYYEFLMVGRACSMNLEAVRHFGDPDWRGKLRERGELTDHRFCADRPAYVAFSRGAYLADLPALAIDSPLCTRWLLWKALVDASEMVLAVRQRDDSSLSPEDENALAEADGPSTALCGSRRHLGTVAHARYLLTFGDVVHNHWWRWRSWQARTARRGSQAVRAWQELVGQLRKLTGVAVARGNEVPR